MRFATSSPWRAAIPGNDILNFDDTTPPLRPLAPQPTGFASSPMHGTPRLLNAYAAASPE